ncbi:hypothetical protein GCM10027258_52460 [Amycolatopsis stemonae]
MGRGRYWFPVALLGFAQLGMVAAQLRARRSPAEWQSPDVLLRPQPAGYGALQFLTQDPLFTPGPGLPAGPAWQVALGVAVLGTAVWYAVVLRPVRTGWFVLGTAGALLAVPLLDLVGSWQFRLADGLRGPLLATLGLLVLAAYERSLLVLLTAVAFAVLAVVLPAGPAGALLSAAVLIAAAFAAVLRPRAIP